MDEVPSPGDLRGAGAVAQALAYALGLAGVVAGAIVLRDGETAVAVAVWVLTFAAGAVLMIAALLTRGVAGLIARVSRMESDLSVLLADRARGGMQPPRQDTERP